MFLKFLLIFILSLNLFSDDTYIDTINFAKIKNLVKKEEQIATAYKKYIMTKGVVPTNIASLTNNSTYLPVGFNLENPFNSNENISLDTTNHKIIVTIPQEFLKTNVYDYYYSNKYRTNTKAPLSKLQVSVKIVLDSKEKFISNNSSKITIDSTNKNGKYFLDSNEVLHWYTSAGVYQFSIAGNNLIVDKDVEIFDITTGDVKDEFKTLTADFLYAGQTIFHESTASALEYINLGQEGTIIKVGDSGRDVGKTILQFTRRAGGMIVNGDIYTWGNNENLVVGIGSSFKDNLYNNTSGGSGSGKPVITALVRAKAKTYNSSFDNINYFSSPLRPKFVDFTSDVWHSTCGVTTNGELYCAGKNDILDQIEFEGYTSGQNVEYLYRSTFFNGTDNKIITLFPLVGTWIALGNSIDENGAGYVYYWGKNNKYGWAGNGTNTNTTVSVPIKTSNIKFKKLTYTLSVNNGGYRRIGALSVDGDIYTWGLDGAITNGTSKCTQSVSGAGNVNLCSPLKVESTTKFETLQGGQQTFIATDISGFYYRISQPKTSGKATLPKAEKIDDLITSYSDYKEEDDGEIISADISSKLDGSSLSYGQGIVWVNAKNELKGDYFTSENKNDDFFKAAISKIKWKIIKVVEDENGMCGIDIYNQMYCWGVMSFYAGSNAAGNTFMLPMLNANLHDLNKDYILASGGNTEDTYTSSNVTNMTSSEWTKRVDNRDAYFIKYPTYFGGFNYEFEFK